MAETTTIEWTNRTWSPWEGCTRVSIAATGGGGCDHCYAERMNRWLHAGANWGPGAPRLEFSDAHWDKLNRWNDAAAKRGERPKVFPSMCDPLDNEVHAGLRDRFWRAIENTPSLTWLVLTKRIGNAQKMLPQAWLKNGWPANLWFGATVVNQAEADRDIPKLLAVPARVRFLSIEPMLGSVDLVTAGALFTETGNSDPLGRIINQAEAGEIYESDPLLHWVICGGESGPHARPMHPSWPRTLRDQCAAAGVPFHYKQHGEWLPTAFCDDAMAMLPCRRTVYVKPDGSYVELGDAVDFFGGAEETAWVGKKAAGRLLDGVEHNGFPEA